jgi:oligosaccharide reducing-end xylanase
VLSRLRYLALSVPLAVAVPASCTSTTDSLGYGDLKLAAGGAPDDGGAAAGGAPDDGAAAGGAPDVVKKPTLMPLVGPAAYENPLHDLLGLPQQAIDKRVEDTFQQLFHGDPADQAIYFTMGDDEALIKDVLHDDTRTEGMGLAMLITVELDKREEFDKLWTYAKRELRYATGSNTGYFRSYCDVQSGSVACVDPYGLEQFVMALIFAHDRWAPGDIDYGADALEIIDVMLHKEDQNGGISADGVTNTFDSETGLVFDVPNTSAASRTRPSILMPAYYELWAQATGNTFFRSAAASARNFLPLAANQKTGLMPLRAYFDGTPVPGADTFTPETYRVFVNLVLDQIWTQGGAWEVTEFDRVLAFFVDQGLDTYGTAYELDGTVVPGQTMHEQALVFVNGMTALRSTIAAQNRHDFIQAVWDTPTPTGQARYYKATLQLFALLVLSGKMQVL